MLAFHYFSSIPVPSGDITSIPLGLAVLHNFILITISCPYRCFTVIILQLIMATFRRPKVKLIFRSLLFIQTRI